MVIVYTKNHWTIKVKPYGNSPDRVRIWVEYLGYSYPHFPSFKTTLKDERVWFLPWTWMNFGVENAVCKAKVKVRAWIEELDEQKRIENKTKEKIQEIDYDNLDCGEK